MLGPQKSFKEKLLSNLSGTTTVDPAKNDAPLDFNTSQNQIQVQEMEGPAVSSSVDSWNNDISCQQKGTPKDRVDNEQPTIIYSSQRRPFDRNREFRRADLLMFNRKEASEPTLIRSTPHVLSTTPSFLSTGSFATPNPAVIGASLMQAVGVEPTQWSLGAPPAALGSATLGQPSAPLGPAFAAMGVGDPSLLSVMGMTGFGQFGFMRTVDSAVTAAAVLGAGGSSGLIVPPNKEVIQLSNCVLYPPKPKQPPPTTRDRPPGCRTVFVGGLPDKCTEEIVREVFAPCGEISTIRMSKKNFCHIRFENESYVDSAIFLSGYRLKITDMDDSPNTGRMHVDYAQARDDQYEWECRERAIQREMRHRERLEQERLRPPSPPTVVHYSDHEASMLTEKLKGEETFQKAAQVLMTWFDRGELSKKNAGQFFSMLQSTNSHIRRLTNEKAQHGEELNRAKLLLKQRIQGIFLQLNQIEKVFLAASHQKVWDHFTKAQRKNIDTWRKLAQEIKNAQLEEILNEREESEMDLSDEDLPDTQVDISGPANKRQKTAFELSSRFGGNTSTDITSQGADDEMARLREENDSLRCQLEAYRNEVEVLRSEARQDKETSDKRIKLLHQALQGMQHQLVAVTQQKTRQYEEMAQMNFKQNDSSGAIHSSSSLITSRTDILPNNNWISDPSSPTSEISSTSANLIKVSEKDVKLIGLVAAFLNVHHFGASIDYIWSYLQHLDSTLQTRDVECLLSKFPSVFKQELSGIGATLERKWKFCGFHI